MAQEGEAKKSHRILGCLGLLFVILASFIAGVLAGGTVRSTLGKWALKPEDIAPDAPEHPYDIRVLVRPAEGTGKMEAYIQDKVTGNARKLDRSLRAGTEEVIKADRDALLKLLPDKTREIVRQSFDKLKNRRSEELKQKIAAEKQKEMKQKKKPEKQKKEEEKEEEKPESGAK